MYVDDRSPLAIGIERAWIRSGLSKLMFARKIRVSPNTLHHWIMDVSKPTDRNLAAVASAAGVTQEDIREGMPNIFGPWDD